MSLIRFIYAHISAFVVIKVVIKTKCPYSYLFKILNILKENYSFKTQNYKQKLNIEHIIDIIYLSLISNIFYDFQTPY